MEKGYNGFMADMWSCGVILYVMLAGKLPFYDKVMSNLFRKIQMGQFNMPDHVSPGAAILIKKLMTVDPHKRIKIEEVLEDPWFLTNWREEFNESGELVRTMSQEQIIKDINDLREKREKKRSGDQDKDASEPPPDGCDRNPGGSTAASASHAIKNYHAHKKNVATKPDMEEIQAKAALDQQVLERRKELDDLNRQKEQMDKLLELKRRELEGLHMGGDPGMTMKKRPSVSK